MAEQARTSGMTLRARVEWWNRSSIYVRCPTCEGIHHHGFDGVYKITHRRLSHCTTRIGRCDYEFQFPFNEASGVVGYEVDKERALFVTGGANPIEYFKQEGDQAFSLSQDMTGRRKWTEAIETVYLDEDKCGIPGGYTFSRLDWAVRNMVCGHVERVRQYLESSTESHIFLHGVEAWDVDHHDDDNDNDNEDEDDDGRTNAEYVQTSGKTTLHLAACEEFPQILELLLQKGADPNVRDITSRTALAEAALWGRLENVKQLLHFGAEKGLECMRNGQRLRAVDFAKPLPVNAEERYNRSGGKSHIYKENTYQRDLDRKAIVRLLEDKADMPDQCSHDIGGFAFTKSPGDAHMLTLIAHFNMPNKWKTNGVLYRGENLPTIAAMSGWNHQKDSGVNIQIGGRDWTGEVRRLCKIVGHSLEPHPHDQGEPGRYHACHAEKQLIAFFIYKHLFLDHETEDEADMARLDLGELSDERYDQIQEERRHKKELSELKSASPAISLRKAKIMVSRPLCESGDCERFVERINDVFGLDIKVAHHCLD